VNGKTNKQKRCALRPISVRRASGSHANAFSFNGPWLVRPPVWPWTREKRRGRGAALSIPSLPEAPVIPTLGVTGRSPL
jgi:hypothetical protein